MCTHAKTTKYVLKLAVISILSLTVSQASAQGKKNGGSAPSAPVEPSATPSAQQEQPLNTDRLDVSDLEKKYWAAKDTDFSVVQNRLYSKAGKFALSGSWGYLVNDVFTEASIYSLGLNYYFNERYGIELRHMSIDSKDNKAVISFRNQKGAVPNYNMQAGFTGAAFNWVPFYAKMSVLGFKILYFDMAFSLGAGVTRSEHQTAGGPKAFTAPTLTFDVSQHYFLSKHFALRVDFKNHWFREDIVGYRDSATTPPEYLQGETVNREMNHTSILMFGGTFYY